MDIFLQLVIGGLAMGMIYALIALGMNLIYNATGGLNYAQGALVALGAYMGVTFSHGLHFPAWLASLCAIPAMAVLGGLYGFFLYEPVRSVKGRFFLVAICAGVFIGETIPLVWGKLPFMVPRFIAQSAIRSGNLVFDTQSLLVIAVATASLCILHVLLTKTQLGLMMRAVGQSKEVSSIMGMPVRRSIRMTFAFSTAMAAIAGIMAGPLFFVSPQLIGLSTKGFAAAAMGGFSPKVSSVVLAGIIIGLVEVFSAFYISSAYRDAWAFLFLICFLLIRPSGIAGEKNAQKA